MPRPCGGLGLESTLTILRLSMFGQLVKCSSCSLNGWSGEIAGVKTFWVMQAPFPRVGSELVWPYVIMLNFIALLLRHFRSNFLAKFRSFCTPREGCQIIENNAY